VRARGERLCSGRIRYAPSSRLDPEDAAHRAAGRLSPRHARPIDDSVTDDLSQGRALGLALTIAPRRSARKGPVGVGSCTRLGATQTSQLQRPSRLAMPGQDAALARSVRGRKKLAISCLEGLTGGARLRILATVPSAWPLQLPESFASMIRGSRTPIPPRINTTIVTFLM
jgi:hypothetical protein